MTTISVRQQRQLNCGACSGKMAWVVSLILICTLEQILPSVAQTLIDELALKSFRDFVTSDPNDALASWDRSADVCRWDHVSCNNDQRVVSLDLSNQGLVGIISASLGALEFLEHLNLEKNSFTGGVPETLGYLANLHSLNLGTNNLNGPLPHSIQMVMERHTRSRTHRALLSKPGTKKTKNVLPVVLGVVAGVVFFIIVFISIFLLWRRYKKTNEDPGTGWKPKSQALDPAMSKKLFKLSEKARKSTKSFAVQELMTATGNFSPKNIIGEGGFGLVYRGTLSTGQEVAIKHAHKDAKQGLEEFYNEVELLSKVHHKYLVDLIGYCDEDGEQLLVYEFIPNGNLFEHLCGQRTPPLTWRQRVQIAICCAKAIAHLHEGCTPPIIHRDIKPSNILIDNDRLAKVADFGLSKTGPLVASKPAVDQKGRNRSSNYSLISWAKDCLRQGQFASIVDPTLRSQGYNRDILMLMVKLGIRCTGEAIKERPTMKAIYEELEHALETLGSLPSVKGSPDSSRESTEDSKELGPDGMGTLGAGENEQFNLYSNICFDGRSWVDIKMLGEDYSAEGAEHFNEQFHAEGQRGQDHAEGQRGQDHAEGQRGQDHAEEKGQQQPAEEGKGQSSQEGKDQPVEQGQENVSPPTGPNLHASKDSLDISINSPKLEAAKRIS